METTDIGPELAAMGRELKDFSAVLLARARLRGGRVLGYPHRLDQLKDNLPAIDVAPGPWLVGTTKVYSGACGTMKFHDFGYSEHGV